jgi:hypothetical protein
MGQQQHWREEESSSSSSTGESSSSGALLMPWLYVARSWSQNLVRLEFTFDFRKKKHEVSAP